MGEDSRGSLNRPEDIVMGNNVIKSTAIFAFFITVGLGGYVVFESKAFSYLSADPKVCANCHVMNTQYATWQHSSHVQTATCVECHLPTKGFVRKYMAKARDGFNHTVAFTFSTYSNSIRISDNAAERVQENCVRCHNQLVSIVKSGITQGTLHIKKDSQRKCWSCHVDVPHGRARGLSSAPFNLGVREVY